MSAIFAERLKGVLEERHVQQKEIAAQLRVSPAVFSAWIKCRSEPSLDMFINLCSILNLSSDYLLGLSDTLGRPKTNTLPAPKPVDPFSDLTPEQRTVMETTLNAFRQQNAAAREEA